MIYQFGGKEYILRKIDEDLFLQQFPDAVKKSPSTNGYFDAQEFYYYKLINNSPSKKKMGVYEKAYDQTPRKVSLDEIFERANAERYGHINLKNFELKIGKPFEVKIFFEFADFNHFLNVWIRSQDYRNKIFENGYIETTKAIFESDVIKSLKYTREISDKKNDLLALKESKEKLIENSKVKILDGSTIMSRLLTVSLIVGLIIYPLRLMLYLGRWAVRTLKNS